MQELPAQTPFPIGEQEQAVRAADNGPSFLRPRSKRGGTRRTRAANRRGIPRLKNTNTTEALTVDLSSSDVSEATVPETAEIRAGQASVDVDLDAIDDDFVDGDKIVVITATAVSLVQYDPIILEGP